MLFTGYGTLIKVIDCNATINSEITVSTTIFDGKGDNLFSNLKDYNMLMFKLKYSF